MIIGFIILLMARSTYEGLKQLEDITTGHSAGINKNI